MGINLSSSPTPRSAAVGKSCNLSRPQFPHVESMEIIVPALQNYREDEMRWITTTCSAQGLMQR